MRNDLELFSSPIFNKDSAIWIAFGAVISEAASPAFIAYINHILIKIELYEKKIGKANLDVETMRLVKNQRSRFSQILEKKRLDPQKEEALSLGWRSHN